MDSPHIDRIVFGRHFRRQDPPADGPTTKKSGLPGLTDFLPTKTKTTETLPATPTTTTTKEPAETTGPATTKAEDKPVEGTGASAITSQPSAVPAETTKPSDNPPASNGGAGSTPQTTTEAANNSGAAQQQPQTTSVTLVIESKTVTGSAAQQTSTLPVGNTGASSKNAFLENKVASGIVFGICGLVGLLLIGAIVWLALRKRRRIRKLEKEIISFDPEAVGGFHQKRRDGDAASVNSIEKAGRSNSSLDQYAGAGYAPAMHANQDGGYRDAAPYSDYPQVQSQSSLQRPGNAAFNPTSGSGAPPGLYAMPPQTYNHLS